jgi:hypothetical protein
MVRHLTRQVMELRARLKTLTDIEPFIQSPFVLLYTRVDAGRGTTIHFRGSRLSTKYFRRKR